MPDADRGAARSRGALPAWRSPAGMRLVNSQARAFDITANGHRLVLLAGRLTRTGSKHRPQTAIALALELSDGLCLHGSAVSLRSGAIAFLGRSTSEVHPGYGAHRGGSSTDRR